MVACRDVERINHLVKQVTNLDVTCEHLLNWKG
jgi:hypothetical protein